jgi:hypothetical protein
MDAIEIIDGLMFIKDDTTVTVVNTNALIGFRANHQCATIHLANNIRFDLKGDLRDKMESACKKRKIKRDNKKRTDSSKPQKSTEKKEKTPKVKIAKVGDID